MKCIYTLSAGLNRSRLRLIFCRFPEDDPYSTRGIQRVEIPLQKHRDFHRSLDPKIPHLNHFREF